MSPSTSTNDPNTTSVGASTLVGSLKAGAFWAAILLPFCALGLLALGPETTLGYLALGAVIALNVLAFVVGHDYRR